MIGSIIDLMNIHYNDDHKTNNDDNYDNRMA